MHVVEISKFEDSVVLHFDTEGKRINAYTLASTLVSLADAAKAANSTTNIGYDIEIVVEAIGPGSFRAKLRAIYTKSRNLFSAETLKTIIIAIIANYIYERTFSCGSDVKIEIKTDEVIIQKGDEKVIVPRAVYDATKKVEHDPRFVGAISRTFTAIKEDPNIKGMGFVSAIDGPPPEIVIPRSAIEAVPAILPLEEDTRIVTENVELQILKAILDRGNRKWEFVWRGIKISAPITDDRFFEQFFAHHITIAPGDGLEVRLAIMQRRDPKTGIFSNEGYEVVEVFKHIPRFKQASFDNAEPWEEEDSR